MKSRQKDQKSPRNDYQSPGLAVLRICISGKINLPRASGICKDQGLLQAPRGATGFFVSGSTSLT